MGDDDDVEIAEAAALALIANPRSDAVSQWLSSPTSVAKRIATTDSPGAGASEKIKFPAIIAAQKPGHSGTGFLLQQALQLLEEDDE